MPNTTKVIPAEAEFINKPPMTTASFWLMKITATTLPLMTDPSVCCHFADH